MQIVLISGPYRARTIFGRLLNVYKARKVAVYFWRKGHSVICPHSNSAFFDGKCSDESFLNGYLELVKCSDIIVMMKNWKSSEGAKKEYEYARNLNKEIIFD